MPAPLGSNPVGTRISDAEAASLPLSASWRLPLGDGSSALTCSLGQLRDWARQGLLPGTAAGNAMLMVSDGAGGVGESEFSSELLYDMDAHLSASSPHPGHARISGTAQTITAPTTFSGAVAVAAASAANHAAQLGQVVQAVAQSSAAFVSPTRGSAGGEVGRPDRPYQTLAQGQAASSLVILQESVSAPSITRAGDVTIVVPEACVLSITSALVTASDASTRRVSISGGGDLMVASTSPFCIAGESSATTLSIDVRRMEMATGHASGWSGWCAITTSGQRLFLRARTLRIHNSGSPANAAFVAYNMTHPAIMVGAGTRIWADGPIFGPGGPGSAAKIHLQTGCMLYRADGGAILLGPGSIGGISAATAFYKGTLGGATLHGSWSDASAWLQDQHMDIF